MHRVTGPNAKQSHSKFVRPGAYAAWMDAPLAQTQKTATQNSCIPARPNAVQDECRVIAQTQKQPTQKFMARGAGATWMNAPRDWPKRKKQNPLNIRAARRGANAALDECTA
jgi:hypothetical protein